MRQILSLIDYINYKVGSLECKTYRLENIQIVSTWEWIKIEYAAILERGRLYYSCVYLALAIFVYNQNYANDRMDPSSDRFFAFSLRNRAGRVVTKIWKHRSGPSGDPGDCYSLLKGR